ncbi:ymd domain protein, partial [Brucella grignonensis]
MAHFFVRGFRTDGIDEFLGHISTIEAALGLPLDHDPRARRRIGGKNPGATHRVALRISGLLKDVSFGKAYSKLF